MTLTIADLENCIRANAYNLVEGSIQPGHDGTYLSFQVTEIDTHDITVGIIGNTIVDTTDGDELYFTLDEYAAFLRGTE